MKKAIHIIAFAAVAIAALTSCAKEELNAIPAGEPIEVFLNGQIGEFTPADATKATAESVVRVTWGSGDKVYVYDGSNASIGTLTVAPDNNNASYAMLSGTITASAASPAPTKLTLVYVKGANEAPAIAGGKISIDLSSQNQAEVPFVLYTTVDYNAAALTKTNEYISFTFATSVMTVNCTGLQTGASGAVEGIDKAEIDGVSTACELTVTGSGVTVTGASKGKITRTGTSVFQQSDSRGSFRLALASDPTAPAARNILVFQGSKVSGAAFTPTTLAEGKSYNTVYQMKEYIAPPAGALPGKFSICNDGGTIRQVYFSRGNLCYISNWMTGSNSFEFETNQYDRMFYLDDSHTGHFFWSKNRDIARSSYYSESSTSAYDILFTNATITTANPDFTVNGVTGKYRTLSAEEWNYLFNVRSVNGGTGAGKSYSLYVNFGAVNGLVLYPDDYTGQVLSGTVNALPEGVVFLPFTGYVDYGMFYDDSNGHYWSSSANDDDEAYMVQFYSGGINPSYSWSRGRAFAIRLVADVSGSYESTVNVSGVTLSKSEMTLNVGAQEVLVAIVTPSDATNKQIIWSSNNPYVASVDANGIVKGESKGSAIITATTADGSFTASCTVNVIVNVTSIILSKSEMTLNVGAKETIVAYVYPTNATNQQIRWSSLKPSVATVDTDGKVTGEAPGSVVITATTVDGGFSAVCLVSVSNSSGEEEEGGVGGEISPGNEER